jgi:hypothetical protein|uniref:Uncharacterized protein n=1 Tax=Zea mays TaxID=4577 RepID=B8A0S2_MAIZE|nr:unknown [Zea mays]
MQVGRRSHPGVWCGGLTRPDPTPIILAVSLTSGFPRHPARAPTSYQTDAMIPRFPPPPPAGTPRRGEAVGRSAAPPPPPLSGHEWQLLKRGVGILATRATATTAAHGHPHHTTPIHHTRRSKNKTRWRTSACLKRPAPARLSPELLDPRHGNAPAIVRCACGPGRLVTYIGARTPAWCVVDRCFAGARRPCVAQ